jgi:hypothetical protein
MQIFSPYSDFEKIAKCLDGKRLNKQKVEIYQILNCISLGDKAKGWKNHPAVRMAKNYEQFFISYALAIANECLARGYKDTLIPKIEAFKLVFNQEYKVPPYWGNEKFHASHRSNLLRKDPIFYGKYNWTEPSDLPYFWPVS